MRTTGKDGYFRWAFSHVEECSPLFRSRETAQVMYALTFFVCSRDDRIDHGHVGDRMWSREEGRNQVSCMTIE